MIELRLPLKDIFINQPFGVNFVDFYQKLGLKGHNGVDFKAYNGCNCYASHGGKVTWSGMDTDGGISVELVHPNWHIKTIYYHLLDVNCKIGDTVIAGDLIGHCDNTGTMTTGSHLHFGLKFLDDNNFNSLNYNNGYKGAVNPGTYFTSSYNGFIIGNKDWNKSRCYHRYYRVAKRNLANEMKTALYMATKLKRLPNNEEINATIWGGWDMETIKNDSMYEIWSQLTKGEFINQGLKSFN